MQSESETYKTTDNVELISEIDTVFTADSVEFCPIEGFTDVFLCGMYQLADKVHHALLYTIIMVHEVHFSFLGRNP